MTALELLTVASVASASCAGLACGLTALNALTWPRGEAAGRVAERVSVLIPARDEQATIEACVRHVMASTHPLHEVIVYDDGSTDATPALLTKLAEEFPKLRVAQGDGLPAGWVGKPHACHRLAKLATGDVLIFLDADTRLSPTGLARAASLLTRLRADVVTAVPRQQVGSVAERLILPLLHVTYTSWFPLALTYLSRDVRFLAANGQFLAVRRAAYERAGGFEAVRREVVDDMALCRALKSSGARVVFADGHHIATCRMYQDGRQVWEGFSKNIYAGLGAKPLALVFVIALYTMTFIAPYVWLGLGLSGVAPELVRWGALGVGLNLALRLILMARQRHGALSVLLHPVATLGLLAIAVNSWRWHRRGAIRWRGRTYAPGADDADASPAPTDSSQHARPSALTSQEIQR